MDGARTIGIVAILGLASGCIGTMDSLHAVKGEAPVASDCMVTVADADTGRVRAKEKVTGTFSVSYTAGAPFPSKVDVAAYCNGVKVKEMKGISPRNTGDTNLGTLDYVSASD